MTEVVPPPAPLVEWLRSRSRDQAIHAHAVKVRTDWWNSKVLPGGPVRGTAADGHQWIARSDLFSLAARASADESGEGALTLLWHTLAWGTGTRHRNNARRIQSVLADPNSGSRLREAAQASKSDPAPAFTMLRPDRRNAYPWLGPNFFTKFLYFAGGGEPQHPCLIVDQFVRAALFRDTGQDPRFRPLSQYGVSDYLVTLDQLRAWAEAAQTEVGRSVGPDEVERWAFASAER
ncbi:hypothetical protein GCM10009584_13380 [Ornithinimicrobium humiphilum]|nr:hypothetical protein [Ornithinimicrobium humiphilum]